MRLNDAARAGLVRRDPHRRRETAAFWAGVAIMVVFELVLMAKSWSPQSSDRIIGFFDRGADSQVTETDQD